jgi:hypothetical protein
MLQSETQSLRDCRQRTSAAPNKAFVLVFVKGSCKEFA